MTIPQVMESTVLHCHGRTDPDHFQVHRVLTLNSTNTQLPYCIAEIISLDRSVTGWACDSTSDGRTEIYYSTYWNASATGISTRASYHNAVYNSYSTPGLRTSTQSSTTTSTTSDTSTTATSTTSSSSVSPTPTPTTADSSPAPIGAIVGGTVGGFAVIGGLALLAYFLFRRSRQQNSQPSHADNQPSMQQPQSPPPPSQYMPYPVQPGYAYGSQPPAQPLYYPEKAPGESTAPIQTLSEMGSPTSTSPDRTSIVPPYVPRHELG